jgi:hypothetical protein
MDAFKIVNQFLLEDKKKKPRKKPVFYYYRLKGQEKEYLLQWKALLEKERKEHDPHKKLVLHIMAMQKKNKLDQIRIQMRVKKNVKNLKSF